MPKTAKEQKELKERFDEIMPEKPSGAKRAAFNMEEALNLRQISMPPGPPGTNRDVAFDKADEEMAAQLSFHEGAEEKIWEPSDRGYFRAKKACTIVATVDNQGWKKRFWKAGSTAQVQAGEQFPHHFLVVSG